MFPPFCQTCARLDSQGHTIADCPVTDRTRRLAEWTSCDQEMLDQGGTLWSGRGVFLFPESLSGPGNPVLNSCAFVELVGAEIGGAVQENELSEWEARIFLKASTRTKTGSGL